MTSKNLNQKGRKEYIEDDDDSREKFTTTAIW